MQRAFPTAEGFGAKAVGGRGGEVFEVTNLEDDGQGSLRSCIEASGPRTCVFRVSGTIASRRALEIRNPLITIAGQTAPGDGVQLRNDPVNGAAGLGVYASDVIIRYLRVRPGPSAQPSADVDGIGIYGGENIIVDHASVSWSTDGGIDSQQGRLTIQWSIIGEVLFRSTHPKGTHSTGMLLFSDGGISVHHCLFSDNYARNPMIRGNDTVDVVNNVIYGTGEGPVLVLDGQYQGLRDTSVPVPVNFVGNYAQPGGVTDMPHLPYVKTRGQSNAGYRLYVRDNWDPATRSVATPHEEALNSSNALPFHVTSPNDAPPVTTTGPEQAFQDVTERAGAVFPVRDAADTRIVREVRDQIGGFVDHPADVGGWPTLQAGAAPVDEDHDGMPDEWERARALDPSDPSDRNDDRNQDGWTNLEEYLNGLVGE